MLVPYHSGSEGASRNAATLETVKVCVIATSYPADEGDASGHFVRAEVRALLRQGHEVKVIAPAPGGAFGWPGVGARVRENPLRIFSAMAWMRRARRELHSARFERVIAHWALPSAFPVACGVREGLEIVSHGGDVRLLVALPSPVRGFIVKDLVGRAKVWRFVSASLRDALRESMGEELRGAFNRIARVEPCAIELPDVRALAEERRRAFAGRRLAVSVGRLVPGKRVERAILHAEKSGDALVIVGDGPERARLEALARARGVNARFVGKVPREEALAWIAAADVLLQASREEGLSTVEREAAAYGVRVEVLGTR